MDYLATMHSMNIAGTGYGVPHLHYCILAQTSMPIEDDIRKLLNALSSDAQSCICMLRYTSSTWCMLQQAPAMA
jgi:hypothetical protein